MISLSFACLLALASALPQPRSQHLHQIALGSSDHASSRYEAAAAAHTRPWKRTDSTGVGDQASVLVCEHIFWAGHCSTKTYNLGTDECALLDGQTSSVKPDPGFTCVFYTNEVCRDFNDGKDSIRVGSRGVEDLRVTEKGDLNDRVRAFQCYRTG